MSLARAALILLVLTACRPEAPVAGVSFLSPTDGATVGDTFTVKLGVQGLTLVPASGTAVAGEAHHHIFVDIDPSPDGQPIPKADGIYHIGSGADSLQLVLPPGRHRVIAVPATGDHVPIPGAIRDTITITVQAPDTTHA